MVATISIAAPLAQAQAPAPEGLRPSPRYDDLSVLGAVYAYIHGLNPFNEFVGVPLPSPRWIMLKAACETGPNPTDTGAYAGMFGIMHQGYETDASGLPNNSSWGRWGGFTFAPRPDLATPVEQIRVFLRIAYAGWHRPNGMFRPPSYSPKTNLCYQYADNKAGVQELVPLTDPMAFLDEIRDELESYHLPTN